jgi:hypothetical protein
MNGIQRTSLAEFSRLYLRSLDADPAKCDCGSLGPPVTPEVSEISFAVQVVLGMSCRNDLSEDPRCKVDQVSRTS